MEVIFNADDFGSSTNVNAAVMLAHQQGVLTSASLMVAGDAVEEAVALAQATPTLAVGLHVVTVNGPATLPPAQIPHLADSNGRFPDDPTRVGLHYFFSRRAQGELARELEAQFQRFAATGLPLSHVDGHLHMHVHPTVFRLLLPLAKQYGAHGFRLPRDDFWLAVRHDQQHVAMKASWVIIFRLLSHWCEEHLREYSLAVTDRVYGLMETGRMQTAYVVDILRRLRLPTAELYFHPAIKFAGEALGPNPTDLATLLSPTVRQVIQERNLRLATYPTLTEGR
ncbi:MAG TPA: ChbG/HpnK family deacetylase [Anaerolineae bacterium]|nr:ChbG/HpnK family deacetylase [Anaerolineae bacterium]HIQ05639.1 ChbG/HpnK family deacetylase [Anaerolineae bacterium]